MKFEPGKFYHHDQGRRIAIAKEIVNTIIWGPSLYIEAYDEHGYEPSLVEMATLPDVYDWTEIGREEYMANWVFVPCEGCGMWIERGANYVETDEGFFHSGPNPEFPDCYKPTMKGIEADAPHIIEAP
tara:strand:- start:13308 stop:13691 length:384 start_codon:yes stop_codon:yes gene_type:complete